MSLLQRYAKLKPVVILLVPYLVLALGSPFLHTCVDHVCESVSDHREVEHGAMPGSVLISASHSNHAKLHDNECPACKWARSSVAKAHYIAVECPIPFCVKYTRMHSIHIHCGSIIASASRAPPLS